MDSKPPPARIWLLDHGHDSCTWCDDPSPSGEDHAAVEYVRVDAFHPAASADQVEVETVETVTGDFLTEPGEPVYRIVIDGYCADFDYKEAAQNFADAINRRIAAMPAPVITEAMEARINTLEAALVDEQIWHEAANKALSKQPRAPDRDWRRLNHAVRIAEIAAALGASHD
jgi:hypothetical protein